jgi:hypothetical protein
MSSPHSLNFDLVLHGLFNLVWYCLCARDFEEQVRVRIYMIQTYKVMKKSCVTCINSSEVYMSHVVILMENNPL